MAGLEAKDAARAEHEFFAWLGVAPGAFFFVSALELYERGALTFGAIFAVKNYPAKTDALMLDELNLPVDMVVTHSFVPINSNIMAGRIKRQLRLMQAANDGAVSLAEELELAQDDLESKRLIFGEHHMTVAVYDKTRYTVRTTTLITFALLFS